MFRYKIPVFRERSSNKTAPLSKKNVLSFSALTVIPKNGIRLKVSLAVANAAALTSKGQARTYCETRDYNKKENESVSAQVPRDAPALSQRRSIRNEFYFEKKKMRQSNRIVWLSVCARARALGRRSLRYQYAAAQRGDAKKAIVR